MAWTFSTSGAAIALAGANTNSTIVADGAQLAIWSEQVENEISAQARYDCVSNWSNLTAVGRQVLGEISDAKIAQKIIAYEPEAIGTIGATIRMNFLQNLVAQGMNKIDDGKIKSYLNITS